jgi:hypothetical protein
VTAALRARLERSIPELTAIVTLTCVYPQTPHLEVIDVKSIRKEQFLYCEETNSYLVNFYYQYVQLQKDSLTIAVVL